MEHDQSETNIHNFEIYLYKHLFDIILVQLFHYFLLFLLTWSPVEYFDIRYYLMNIRHQKLIENPRRLREAVTVI
jgi:hypothetical protein